MGTQERKCERKWTLPGVVDDLAGAVREAFEEAKETFTSISSPLGMHEFVEQVVGPMTLLRDGRVVPSSEARPRYPGHPGGTPSPPARRGRQRSDH
jgi:hypothetical protein